MIYVNNEKNLENREKEKELIIVSKIEMYSN